MLDCWGLGPSRNARSVWLSTDLAQRTAGVGPEGERREIEMLLARALGGLPMLGDV